MDPQLIRDARKRKGMSQGELAKHVGVVPSQISRFENGTRVPRITEAEKIASALGIPVSEIAVRDEHRPNAVPWPSSPKTSKSMLALKEGQALFEYPTVLSACSRAALKQWLDVIRAIIASESE